MNVAPVAAYSFNFAIPTLNSDATLIFDIGVAILDTASRSAFLTALSSDSATLVVKLDAAGNPTAGTPATVRFTGVVGHFSTWAVVVVTPRDVTAIEIRLVEDRDPAPTSGSHEMNRTLAWNSRAHSRRPGSLAGRR